MPLHSLGARPSSFLFFSFPFSFWPPSWVLCERVRPILPKRVGFILIHHHSGRFLCILSSKPLFASALCIAIARFQCRDIGISDFLYNRLYSILLANRIIKQLFTALCFSRCRYYSVATRSQFISQLLIIPTFGISRLFLSRDAIVSRVTVHPFFDRFILTLFLLLCCFISCPYAHLLWN